MDKQTRCCLSRRAPEEAASSGRLFPTSALNSSREETSSYHLSCFHVGERGGASTNEQPAQKILQFAISENLADVGHRTIAISRARIATISYWTLLFLAIIQPRVHVQLAIGRPRRAFLAFVMKRPPSTSRDLGKCSFIFVLGVDRC